MEMRVEQLSARSGVPVDTVRYYQSKGLLAPPRRQGRVAWYDEDHLERLARVRTLQQRGFTLATIVRLINGELDAADEALIGELSGLGHRDGMTSSDRRGPTAGTPTPPEPGAPGSSGSPEGSEPSEGPGAEVFTIAELAVETGVPLALLKAVEAEGLLIPRRIGGQDRYTAEDVEASRAGLLLLEWGIPLSALLDVARRHNEATKQVAVEAVDLFSTYVRGRLPRPSGNGGVAPPPGDGDGGGGGDGSDPGIEQLLRAYEELLPAVTTLVGHHFTRALVQAALDHVEQVASDEERRAIWDQIGPVGDGVEADTDAGAPPRTADRAVRTEGSRR